MQIKSHSLYGIPFIVFRFDTMRSLRSNNISYLDLPSESESSLYAGEDSPYKLNEHLREIDKTAFERRKLIIKQMKVAQGVTEQR